jgi:hypothetical protein
LGVEKEIQKAPVWPGLEEELNRRAEEYNKKVDLLNELEEEYNLRGEKYEKIGVLNKLREELYTERINLGAMCTSLAMQKLAEEIENEEGEG